MARDSTWKIAGMSPLERAAEISVGRAVAFTALAIAVTMAGFAFDPPLAFATGAVLTLALAGVLEFKARLAPRVPYRRTEVWLMLEPAPRWSPEVAQRLVAGVLARTFRHYARLAVAAAVGLWLVSLAFRLT